MTETGQSTESMQVEEPSSKPERKHWFRAITVLLGLLAASIIVFILWLLTITGGKPGATFSFAERYNELTRPPDFNEGDNAADLYRSALACFREMPDELKQHRFAWPGELDDEGRAMLGAWLESNEEAFEYAHTAANKPYYWVPRTDLDGEPLLFSNPDLAHIGNLVRALNRRAVFCAFNRQYPEAFADIETIWHIGAHLSGPRMLIEQLWSMSIRRAACNAMLTILSNSQPEPELPARCQAFFEEHTQSLGLSFAAQELVVRWYIQKLFTDDGHGDGHLILNEWPPFSDALYGRRWSPPDYRGLKGAFENLQERWQLTVKIAKHDGRKTTTEKAERVFALLEELASQTPRQSTPGKPTPGQELMQLLGTGQELFLQRLVDWSPIQADRLARSTQAATIVVVAAMRYKADKGAYPDTGAELRAAGYLTALPETRYSEQPLVYKKTDAGFVLYSFGRDRKDNGGKTHEWHWNDKDCDYIYWPVPVREVPKESPGRYGNEF